jgi:HTH-type transcriptional regulator, glycine betaine synthesis regulator
MKAKSARSRTIAEDASQTDCDQLVRRMTEAAGYVTQSLGAGRVIGQIFAFLYFSKKSRTLDEITRSLSISKGSASMCVRQLEQWGAVDKIWVRGDRKDYYKAKERLGGVLKNAVADIAGKRIESSAGLMDAAAGELHNRQTAKSSLSADEKFILDRVKHLQEFHQKARAMWNGVIMNILLH